MKILLTFLVLISPVVAIAQSALPGTQTGDPATSRYARPGAQNPLTITNRSTTSRSTSGSSFQNDQDLPLWQEEVGKAPWQRKAGVAHYTYGDKPITIHTRVGMPTALTLKGVAIADVQNGGEQMITAKYTPATAGSIYITAVTPNVDVGLTVISKSGVSYSFTVRTYSLPKAKYYMDREVYVTVPSVNNASTSSAETVDNSANRNNKTYRALPAYAKQIPYSGVIATPHAIYEKEEGSSSIAPMRVWEDKNRTYFEFGGVSEHPLPVIYLLQRGVEKEVNMEVVDMDNNIVVVDRKGSFILRYDRMVICVINKRDPLYATEYAKNRLRGKPVVGQGD